MMRFDAIVSFHVRHDVICFKLGKCLDVPDSDVVIPWTALTSSQSKTALCGPTMFHFVHSQHPLQIPNNGRSDSDSDFFLQKKHLIKNVAKKSLVHKKSCMTFTAPNTTKTAIVFIAKKLQ